MDVTQGKLKKPGVNPGAREVWEVSTSYKTSAVLLIYMVNPVKVLSVIEERKYM